MKVIFLDVDGVLNSDEYIDRTKNQGIQGIERDIDVEKIKLLKKLVKISNGNGRGLGEGLLISDIEEIIKRLGRVKKEELER